MLKLLAMLSVASFCLSACNSNGLSACSQYNQSGIHPLKPSNLGLAFGCGVNSDVQVFGYTRLNENIGQRIFIYDAESDAKYEIVNLSASAALNQETWARVQKELSGESVRPVVVKGKLSSFHTIVDVEFVKFLDN